MGPNPGRALLVAIVGGLVAGGLLALAASLIMTLYGH